MDVFCDPALELPRILSSASHLVDLRLKRVGSTRCISPEALVAALSTTARLKTLYLDFSHGISHSNPRNIPPTSSGFIVSSTLLHLTYFGPCNYLEDLLSRISTPSLERTRITFFKQPEPSFDLSQLSQFLGRVESQSLPDCAEVRNCVFGVCLSFTRSVALPGGQPKTECLWLEPPYQSRLELSVMTQVCQQTSPFLSSVRTLSILLSHPWRDVEHGAPWVDILRVFSRVERLHLSKCPSLTFACALHVVSPEMAADIRKNLPR